jgi:DNA-binding beta-propeller fold protein YncE
VTTGDGSVWVANSAGGTVSRINPTTRTVVSTDHLGGNPLSLAVVDGSVYLADGSGQSVRTIYPAPVSKKLDLGVTPRLLLPVDGGIWVASANPGRVLEVKPG